MRLDQDVHHVALTGDFDPDHGGDFFYTTHRPDGFYQWWYVHYHPSQLSVGDTPLAYAATNPGKLRFADFNGDGVTDVFHRSRTC